jgi:hypothetical protein
VHQPGALPSLGRDLGDAFGREVEVEVTEVHDGRLSEYPGEAGERFALGAHPEFREWHTLPFAVLLLLGSLTAMPEVLPS